MQFCLKKLGFSPPQLRRAGERVSVQHRLFTMVLSCKLLQYCYMISAMFDMEESGVCERRGVPLLAFSDVDCDA